MTPRDAQDAMRRADSAAHDYRGDYRRGVDDEAEATRD